MNTKHRWGTICCHCHDFMEGDLVVTHVIFECIVHILAPGPFFQWNKGEKVLFDGKISKNHSDKHNQLGCVRHISGLVKLKGKYSPSDNVWIKALISSLFLS